MRHIKSHVEIICGKCNEPAAKHGFTPSTYYPGYFIVAEYGDTEFDQIKCDRMPEDIGTTSLFDDYQIIDGYYSALVPDVSGPAANTDPDEESFANGEVLDAYNYVSPTHEWEALERWSDKTYSQYERNNLPVREWIATSLQGEPDGEVRLSAVTYPEATNYTKDQYDPSNEVEWETRNAYVEHNDGFLAIRVLNEELTRKHHARMLNVYVDRKTKDLRVGGVRIVKNADGTITAQCVQDTCGGSATINPTTATREQMETFVWALIAHGNNHAARFIRSREDFYVLHNPGCAMTEDLRKTRGRCVHRSSESDLSKSPDDESVVQFLFEHQKFCNDASCQCSERLAEELQGAAV